MVAWGLFVSGENLEKARPNAGVAVWRNAAVPTGMAVSGWETGPTKPRALAIGRVEGR